MEKKQAIEDQCTLLCTYRSLISKGKLVSPTDRLRLHGTIAELYLDYFKSGRDIQGTSRHYLLQRQAQESFIQFNFDTKVVLESPSNYIGPAHLLKQAELYTTFYQAQLQNPRVLKMDMDGYVFQLSTTLCLTFRHHTISTLYPHMLGNKEFMQKVMGQQVSFQLQQVFHFDENHKVVYLCASYDFASGWCKFLQNPRLVAQVLSDQKLKGVCIDLDERMESHHNTCVMQEKAKYLTMHALMNPEVN